MRKGINDFKATLTANETLTNVQLFTIKGGDGDDKRRDDMRVSTTILGGTTTTGTKPKAS